MSCPQPAQPVQIEPSTGPNCGVFIAICQSLLNGSFYTALWLHRMVNDTWLQLSAHCERLALSEPWRIAAMASRAAYCSRLEVPS